MFTGRTAERIALFLCLPLLVVISLLTWRLWEHVDRLDDELAASQQREAGLRAQVREKTGREELAHQAAAQARRDAERNDLARAMAVSEAEQSRLEATLAVEEAERQKRLADEIRKRRTAELDSMRDALAQIAETERTPMGVVVSLGDGSFLFDFDKAELRPENREILSRISGVLLASYGYSLYVYGHTDDQGDPTYNQQLSERRADAVKQYLVSAGIPGDIIESKGFGSKSPREEGSTAQARQKNRRVEIGIIDTVIEYQGEASGASTG